MKCLKCNNEINDNSKFCEFCGNKVENTFNQNLNYNTMNNVNSNVTMSNTIQNTNSNSFNNSVNTNMNNNMINNQNPNNNLNSINGLNQDMSNDIINNNNMINNVNSSINTNVNNMMDDFKTLNGALNLFRSVNCIGNQNIILIAHKNSNSGTMTSMIVGGAIGSIASSMERTAGAGFKVEIGEYDALVLNFTEYGIGFIPLKLQGKRLTKWTMDKMQPNMSNFVFVSNNSIEKITVKNNSIIDKSKRIILKIQGNVTFDLIAYMEEKLVPYQKDSMNSLVSMYSK